MRKILLSIIGIGVWLLFTASQVDAAVLNKVYDRKYRVEGDHVHVTETITARMTDPNFYIAAGSKEVFTVFNPILDDAQAQTKIDQALPTIRVYDQNGTPQAFTTEVSGQDVAVSVPRQRDITYYNSYVLTIEYDSYSLLAQSGALRDLYIPTFAKEFQFNDDTTSRTFNTQALIPKSLGEINLVTPEKSAHDAGDHWQFDFTQQELTDSISWIQIGTVQYYEFTITQPYPTSSDIPFFFNTFSVLLPRDIGHGPSTQAIKFTEISPTPDSVVTDSNGNLIANFVVPANQSGQIIIRGFATATHNLQPNIKDSGNLEDIPQEIREVNTHSAQYWEVNAPEILAAANELKGDTTNVYELMSRTYQFVVDKIDYDQVKRFGLNERQGALKTLLQGSGVCMEYSDLFITLMRAQGIPARGAFGYGYDSRTSAGETEPHQWAEVYIPKLQAWVSVDTTWGEEGPSTIGGSLNHFYKYIASVDPNTPSPIEVAYFGNLGEVANESFNINALSALPDTPGQTQADLLAAYPAKSDLTLRWESFTRGVGLAWNAFDTKAAEIVPDTTVRRVLYGAAVLLVVATVGYSQRRRRPSPPQLAAPPANT